MLFWFQKEDLDSSSNNLEIKDPAYDSNDDIFVCFKYYFVILVAHRFGISSRATALMINALLKDLNIVDRSKIVNHKRILKLKNEAGQKALDAHTSKSKRLSCIQFDGKTSDSMMPHSKRQRIHKLTAVSQPGGDYLDHFKCGEKGYQMADGIVSLIEETDSYNTILALGTGKIILFWGSV